MKNLLNARGKILDCSTPLVMGILNLTPDSFFDGGKWLEDQRFLKRVETMIREGASIIDVGAQSTRPGAVFLSPQEEWERLEQPLKILCTSFPETLFSIDTFHSEVAERAIHAGAAMVNDVSGGNLDERMFETIGRLQVPYVLMHMQGTPATMQQHPSYDDVVSEVMDFFCRRIELLLSHRVHDIVLDPGFGFGKTQVHNFELLAGLSLFGIFDRPVLAGLSRKSMASKTMGTTPEHALNATTVLNTLAVRNGAALLRVHDVKEAMEVIRIHHVINSVDSRTGPTHPGSGNNS